MVNIQVLFAVIGVFIGAFLSGLGYGIASISSVAAALFLLALIFLNRNGRMIPDVLISAILFGLAAWADQQWFGGEGRLAWPLLGLFVGMVASFVVLYVVELTRRKQPAGDRKE